MELLLYVIALFVTIAMFPTVRQRVWGLFAVGAIPHSVQDGRSAVGVTRSEVQQLVTEFARLLEQNRVSWAKFEGKAAGLNQSVQSLDETLMELRDVTKVHLRMASVRLGADQSDQLGALARLRMDVQQISRIPGREREALRRKATSLLVELEKCAEDYELSQLLREAESKHFAIERIPPS